MMHETMMPVQLVMHFKHLLQASFASRLSICRRLVKHFQHLLWAFSAKRIEHLRSMCLRAGASCLEGHARAAEGAAAHPAGLSLNSWTLYALSCQHHVGEKAACPAGHALQAPPSGNFVKRTEHLKKMCLRAGASCPVGHALQAPPWGLFAKGIEHLKKVCLRAGASRTEGDARPAEGAAAHLAGPPGAAARRSLPCPGSCCRQLLLRQPAACSTPTRAHTKFHHAWSSCKPRILSAQLW